MTIITAEHLIHRGTVLTAGFLFSAANLPEPEMRRRVLSLWQPGAQIFRHETFLLLLFSQPYRVDCRRAPALSLVRYDKILAAFPLSQKNLEQFKDLEETIVFLAAGRLRKIEIRAFEVEKIETWFDTSGFQLIITETLGAVVQTKPILVERVAALDLREELVEVPTANAEMSEILKVLRQKTAEKLSQKNNQILSRQSFSNAAAAQPTAALTSIFASAFDALKNLFGSNKANSQNSSLAQSQKTFGAANKLRSLLTKALFQMRVAQILGRKQAAYLAKMMEMFERGDLEEALKHAIPLEDMRALQELTESAPFLGFLRPRDNLNINYGRGRAAGSSVFLENNWFEHLNKTYRQTFERLAAQGKIEEAAFILAELLKSNAEAVEFLEKHGQLRLAAELAEARDLPKEIVVRQWFLAGEKGRAIQLAVLHNCFEYVVTRLEKENHPRSAELRVLWAETLAESGNLPAAVNVIWSLERERRRAKDWINQTIEFGGVPAAQMLVKKVTLFPDSFPEVKAKLDNFLSETGHEAAENLIAVAREATRQTPNDELQMLVRPVARKILANWTENSARFSAHEFRELIAATSDFALRTDLPKLPLKQENSAKTEFFSLEIAARDLGANHIYDAALLPDGKIAVALGEAGVKILSRDNKTIEHFDQPTQKFVVSDSGTKAIGLIARGDSYRLTKFDFLMRRAVYWCEASFTSFAPTFDGSLWFVGFDATLFAIDASAAEFAAVWQVSEVGGNVYKISRSKTKLIVLINMPGKGFEKWSYDLPNLVLRSRNQVQGWHQTENENQYLLDVKSSPAYSIAVKKNLTDKDHPQFDIEIYDYETHIGNLSVSGEKGVLLITEIVDKQYVVVYHTEIEMIINLYTIPDIKIASFRCHKPSASLPLNGFAKLDEKNLTITDGFGRVIIFDYQDKILRKNLRY